MAASRSRGGDAARWGAAHETSVAPSRSSLASAAFRDMRPGDRDSRRPARCRAVGPRRGRPGNRARARRYMTRCGKSWVGFSKVTAVSDTAMLAKSAKRQNRERERTQDASMHERGAGRLRKNAWPAAQTKVAALA